MSEIVETPNSEPQPTSTAPGAAAPESLISEAAKTPEELAETPEAKAEREAAEAAAAEAAKPLTVEDIVLPEGFTPDEELQTEFLTVMNNQELSPKDRMNALIDLQAKLMTKASEAGSAAWDKMQTEWRDAVKADPVIGGDKLQPALASVNKLITEYGSKELNDVLTLTGAGNNVHVVKFLHTLAGKLTEGSFTQGQPSNAPASAAALLYPSMKG